MTFTEQQFEVRVSGGSIMGHRGGSGPAALMLHGGPGIPDYMDSCASEVAELFRIARYTQRGVAPSVASPPYNVEVHMADALTILNAHGNRRAWVIGHSWGGQLALHLLVQHPERLLGVICIAALGAYREPLAEFDANRRRLLKPEQMRQLDAIETLRRQGGASERSLLARAAILWPGMFAHRATAPPFATARIGIQAADETNLSMLAHLAAGTLADGLPHARLPVLFLHGEADPLPLRSAIATARLIKSAQVEVIPECGHYPWLEQPGAVRSAVERFVTGTRQ